VEPGLFCAVLHKVFDGAEVDGFDAQAEDVEAVFVGDEGLGALSHE